MKRLAIGLAILSCLSFGLVSPAADFNGDGYDDIAVFRESAGLWAVRGVTRAYFGSKLDIPIPGNYCGGSAAEIGIFRPGSGLWAVRNCTRVYFGTDGDLPLGESGLKQSTKFFYDPAKYAFRAGQATGPQWQGSNIGDYSAALGRNTIASGYASFAMGQYSRAQAKCAFAMGESAYAGSSWSTAIGAGITASGRYAMALGSQIEVSGDHSFGFGTSESIGFDVQSDNSFVIHGANVGVGIGTPAVEMDIQDNYDADNDVCLRLRSNSTNNDSIIEFYENTAAAMSLHYDGGSSPNKLVIKDLTTSTDLVTFERSGNVGIGTDAPDFKLVVDDTVDSGGLTYVLNRSSDAEADALTIKINRSTPGATNSFVSCHKANGAMIGGIVGNGSGGVEFWSYGSDFAEFLPRLRAGEEIEAGDVVGVFGGKISKVTHEADQVQAISTAPIVSGNAPDAEEEHLYEKVAFLGRAPVKLRGPVRSGDYIVPSGLNDGTGMAVSSSELTPAQAAQVGGRAWEASDEEGVKTIEVAVGLQSSAAALCEVGREKDRQIARMEERLSLLEEKLAKLEAR